MAATIGSRSAVLSTVEVVANDVAQIAIFAPAAPQAVSEFDVHSLQLATFVVSVDVLGFAFGPLLLAPLSEVYGRVKLYSACNIAFLISTVLCGSAPNMNFLIVFRFLSGTFGAGAGTVGAGAIADMVRPEKRAGVMALCGIGSLLGPILGPIFGGFINASWGWRWTQWTVAIAAAVPAISIFFTFKECYHPVLLERKVAKLRNETGKLSLKSKYDQGLSPANYLKRSIVRPLKLLFRSPIVAMSALFIGMSYAILFVMFTSLSTVFHDTYHFSESGIGLSFVGLGVGSAIGVVVYSVASNRYMTKKKAANSESVVATNENDTVANQDAPGANADGSPPESLEQAAEGLQPEDRLFLLPIGSLMTPIGLLIFGWTVQYRVHWIVPIMSTSLISGGNFIIYMSLQMFLMDSFPTYSASALAAMMVVRSLLAAFLPLSGLELYDKLGFGWGNTLLAFLLVLFIPVAFLGKRFGGVLRKRYKINNL